MHEHHDEKYWLGLILKEDNRISKILHNSCLQERADIAEDLIVDLRHFVQNIQCFIREHDNPKIFESRIKEEEASNDYCKSKAKYKFLSNFLDNLNSSVGHQVIDGEYAVRLMQKYIVKLFMIKKALHEELSVDILADLTEYPLDLDESFSDYYRRISSVLSDKEFSNDLRGCDQYYVQKKKPIIIDNKLFYEYTLTNSNDNQSKFDRFIAFSLIDIFPNYSIKTKLVSKKVNFLGTDIDYFVIVGYQVSIRPCELRKLANIVGLNKAYSRNKGYFSLMEYIKEKSFSLLDVIRMDDSDFADVLQKCFTKNNENALVALLKVSRKLILGKYMGYKTLSYLLHIANNSVIEKQLPYNPDDSFDEIKITKKAYPFERNPFTSGLFNHRPKLSVLLDVFDPTDYKGDILARLISKHSIA